MKIVSASVLLVLCGLASLAWGQDPPYRWVKGSDSSQVHLYSGSRQVGTYRYDDGNYYPFDGTKWLAAGDPPSQASLPPGVHAKSECPCPTCKGACQCKKKGTCCGDPACKCCKIEGIVAPRPDFGNLWVPSGEERYSFNGMRVPREFGLDMIQNGIPDDRTKFRVTALCKTPEACKRVAGDVRTHPALAPYRDRIAFLSYDLSNDSAGNFAVKDFGFQGVGDPTIYVQAPPGLPLLDRKGRPMSVKDASGRMVQRLTVAGDVLHRQDDYSDGPEGLAKGLAGAIRRVDPNYQPAKDPDLRNPEPILPDGGEGWLALLRKWSQWIVMGGVWLLVWVFTPKPEGVVIQS